MSRRKRVSRVKRAREKEGLTKVALAREAGISERTLRRIEEGETNVTEVTRSKLVKAFNRIPDKLRTYSSDYLFPDA